MKKIRVLSFLLALILMLNAAPAAFATPETTAPAETTVPVETSLPMETVPEMAADFLGDASVEYGARTLDAKKPLADTDDYTADAKAAVLYDLGSDMLVFAQDADVQLYPASLTMVMTCLLTLEMQPDLDAMVTVTKAALKGMEPGSSNAALQVDEQMSVRDLLYCLMVKSANDAAFVLAIQNSGSVEAFVEVMNQRAAEIGCTGTHFMNPNGLHHDEHYTTARDMARILREAMKHPAFEEIISTKEYTVPATNLSEERLLKTTNYMIRSNGYPIVLDARVIGGKTGYTSKAGRCFAAVAEKDGMKLVSVVLGTKAIYQEDGYSFVRYGNFEETDGLLDFAYERYTTMQVLNPTQTAGQFSVSGGEHDAFGTITEPMSASVPLGSGYNHIRYEYTLKEPLQAPVAKGDVIGMVRVWYGGTCLAQQDLLSATDVAEEQLPARAPEVQSDDEPADWNGILWMAVIIAALLLVLMVLLRIRAANRRSRRRRKAATSRRGRY